MTLHTYLPQDRLRALARGESLPDRTNGSALFADISGFTPLTETLRESLGPRRGAEELTKHLDDVYTALITEVERYGGSVIGFAGDAMTCWFDDAHGPAAPRATACAFALQQVMRAFTAIVLPNGTTTALALKAAVATGPSRRFIVGDPAIQCMDALAGATVARTSTAEHLAQKGDVLLDEVTVAGLGAALTVSEWRTDVESGERFAVAGQLSGNSTQLVVNADDELLVTAKSPQGDDSVLRPFILPAVYEREQSGQETFLTEFRPCVALFVRFVGIDYDADEAGAQLGAFIRQAQAIVARHDGTLLHTIIGDKGSYTYITLGALSSHEDDVRRAVKIALELRKDAQALGFLAPLQMGLTLGIMRVGAYGGPTRHTYSALGDDVNFAARLMQAAALGEILISGPAQKAVAHDFVFEPRPPLAIKGKAEPLPVFAVTSERQQRAIRLQEPAYALPMVGRQVELQTIAEKLNLALNGQAQIIGIVAEAGMGKSRLVAEVIRLAHKKGFTGYGGACQSDALNTPYQTWKSIWQAFFDVDPSAPLRKQIRSLENEIEDRAPERVNALPLLGTLLNLEIPDNDFTKTLEPKSRKSMLHALLEDCLKAATKDEPLLIVIEDLHWIDALSNDLFEELARAMTNYPICFVLAYRPPQLARLIAPRLEALPHFTKIELSELNATEAEQAIRAKLAQLYPARGGAVPPLLVDELMKRAQGNPFYLEELLNFLRDRGLDPSEPATLDKIELPDSLHTLILARVDQLTEREKTTLRVASIIGRLFRAAWLPGYYPALGTLPQVKTDLDELDKLDITPLDTPESELAYLFKHLVTREVAYESLPFATRAQLHEQLARYLEIVYSAALPLDALAHHYSQSNNQPKQVEYLRKAGETAQAAYANEAALDYYARLLPLLTDPTEKIDLHLKRGAVLELVGQWEQAETHYRDALALAQARASDAHLARCQLALGELSSKCGDFVAALEWLEQSRATCSTLDDKMKLVQSLADLGWVYWLKGEYDAAQELQQEGLTLARALGDKLGIALALHLMGAVPYAQGNYTAAKALFQESLAQWRELGKKEKIAAALSNLGVVAYWQNDFAASRAFHEESLALGREMGDKWGIAASLINLGAVVSEQGDYTATRALFQESLTLQREVGDKRGIAMSLYNLGVIARDQGNYPTAQAFHEESLALRREMGDKRGMSVSLHGLGNVARDQGNYPTAQAFYEEGLALSREIGGKQDMASSLDGLGDIACERCDYSTARGFYEASLTLRREMDDKWGMGVSNYNLGKLVCVQGDFATAQSLFETSLALSREMEDSLNTACALFGLGLVALAQAETTAARRYLAESLKLREKLGNKRLIASNLAGLAGVAFYAGSPQRAARLAGNAEALLVSIQAKMEVNVRPVYEHTAAATREMLGEAAFQAAWMDGEKMTLEQILAEALSWGEGKE